MSQVRKRTDEKVPETSSSNNSDEVLLLGKKQWLYVQKRHNLTPRECQIAELICQGLRNGNIAKYLNIKPGTVKTHIRNIYRKIKVESKITMLLKFVTETRNFTDQHQSIPSSRIVG
jgi:DNA-binding NarL/FixJ family response regulator